MIRRIGITAWLALLLSSAVLAGGVLTAQVGMGGADPDVVTLTAYNAIDEIAGSQVSIRFVSDGTVDAIELGTFQIHASTNWVIPNGSAPGLYEVMTDNWADIGGCGGGFSQSSGAEGAWVALTSSRTWGVTACGVGGSNQSGMSFDAHIRYNGGSTLASASYTVSSEQSF